MREPLSDSNRSRIHQRRAKRAHVLQQKSDETHVIEQAGQFGGDHANVFGAFGHGQAGELLDAERISPVVGHRAEIIEPVGVRHRPQIARVLRDLLVIAMQIAEDRLELHHRLAVEHHVHAKHAVRGRMLRPHRDFQQLAADVSAVSFRHQRESRGAWVAVAAQAWLRPREI
jgi:hypothetical protein